MVKEENKFNFEKDERVLCYHGPFVYEAKILKRKEDQEEQDENQYFVHYKGWKQTWDEWVTEDRVLKYTDTNLQKQKQLKESSLKRKSSRASVSASQTPENTTEPRSRKRYRDSSIDKTRLDDDNKRSQFQLIIPDTLKGLLVDDWENITKNRQVLTLPREATVDKILEDFRAQCPIKDEALGEFIQGVLLYFNKMIGTSLLYRSERKQFEEMCGDKEPSSVYGAEHLLRLFVELPSLMSATNIDADTMAEVKERLEELLRFVQENEKDYFPSDYCF
ncbi:Chromatin modification-related protein eaf3 [Choanephora cucurbitarum]|uniref:Chromatin modification-related protein EAF3 n=1 Tax=Choanephora cucurbitarum TaxID=101091 RepID=A0A1C7NIB1_9FUNG|nr:Chromatin modification-related protein eaf3 [Choanephora cucurbitarum]